MISMIVGRVTEVNDGSVVMLTDAGIGFEVGVTKQTAVSLSGKNEIVTLYTYLQVKEDGMSLFGFLSKDELELFKLFISVSGIGPKIGLAILGADTSENLIYSIMTENVGVLSKLPGIGAKTAGKIVFELKDKIKKFADTHMTGFDISDSGSEEYVVRNEASEALMSLGYSMSDVNKVLKKIEILSSDKVEDVIKKCLKNM